MPLDPIYTPSDDLSNLFRAAELAARIKTGLLSEVEIIELNEWLEESPDHLVWLEKALESLPAKLEDFSQYDTIEDISFQKICTSLELELPEERHSLPWRWVASLAARCRGLWG